MIFDLSFDRTFQSWANTSGKPLNDIKEKFKFDDLFDKFEKAVYGRKDLIKHKLIDALLFLIPFKKYLSIFSLKTNAKAGLEYRCIAFRKIDRDRREWDWDTQF